ncbi:hypothetical protein WDU94_007300 [Cyamophila willieti]
MSSAPTHYPNRNSLRRQSKTHQQQTVAQRNPWIGTGATGSSSAGTPAPHGQDLGSGYSGNSDTLSSGSYHNSNTNHKQHRYKGGTGQIVCHQPEPAYENVIGGGAVGGGGRLTLGRYGTSSVVPVQATTSVRKSHHHQGGTTTLYTLDGRGGSGSRGHNHVTYLGGGGGGGGANTPLIELNSPGSRGSTTSHEAGGMMGGANNIYDVIEEKNSSSRGRGGTSRGVGGGTLHSPTSLGLGFAGAGPGGASAHYNRPMTPASVKTCASETGVYACGGHCLPFERVCDKILRVVYGIGVLVGIGLLLAGMNGHQLRQHQNTLMYIGLMVFCVCCLLLWIQCRHYASRRRYRHRHHGGGAGASHHHRGHQTGPTLASPQQNMIPMTDFVNGTTGGNYMLGGVNYSAGTMPGVRYMGGAGVTHTLPGGGGTPLMLSHENPLLHRYIEQQSSYTPPPPLSELETHATSSLYAMA